MGFPKLKEYFYASQFRQIASWCKPDYTAKWKDMEIHVGEYPIQSIIRDKETYKTFYK